ncbi:MAG: polysaccharide lyase beta-sandwich domain-containing protein [bacterium]|nr:polysaccharide lyase beta-sandwich domain-containing protein [bacterium]
MPDADADGQAPVIELAANTASLQVVREVNLGLTGVVFYEAGIADLGQHGTLAADMACLLLLLEAGDRLALSAANPLNAAADLTLTLSQKLTGDGVVDLPGGGSQLVLVLPDGRSAGQSVTREFGKP